jgi:hypothetical protein
VFNAPSMFPALANTAGNGAMSCITAAFNAWNRSNLYLPSIAAVVDAYKLASKSDCK